MNKKIKIGVLGAANIAERYILPAINNLEANFDLIGISSRSLEKAQKIALQFVFVRKKLDK
jgi:predicted dehydrogenase